MSNSNEPFFIFGCGRSGTSLLSRMLNHHSRIAVPLESHIYDTFYPLVKYYGDLSRKSNQLRLIKDMLSADVIKDWEPGLVTEEIMGCLEDDSFGGIFNAIMTSWTLKCNKQRWGEKTPQHIDYFDQISTTWPEVKIIHIYRDGRDVAQSFLKAKFGPKTIINASRRWTNYLRKVKHIKTKINPDMFLEVAYEQLLENPKETLTQVCEFLHELFEENMLLFYQNPSPYNTDEYNRQNLARPLLRNNKEKWRISLSESEIRVFEAISRASLDKYSYARINSNPVLHPLEKISHDCFLLPVKKTIGMIKNSKGQKEAIFKMKTTFRIIVSWFYRELVMFTNCSKQVEL